MDWFMPRNKGESLFDTDGFAQPVWKAITGLMLCLASAGSGAALAGAAGVACYFAILCILATFIFSFLALVKGMHPDRTMAAKAAVFEVLYPIP